MRIILVCCALFIATASAAQAANRFATPAGTGLACTAVAPCAIETAIGGVGNGDDVTLAPGTYGSVATPLASSLAVSPADVSIHATRGQPAVIYSATSYALELVGPGDRVSDVVVHQRADNGSAFYLTSTARADRVMGIAESPSAGAGGTGCVLLVSAQISNSVCLGVGAFANGLSVQAGLDGPDFVTARNVTAIARNAGSVPNDNQGDAILLTGVAPRAASLTMINSIAIGAEHDVRLVGVSGGFASLVTSHSYELGHSSTSFTSFSDGAGLLTTAPAFLGATDFHQAIGSSSIDAGGDDAANGAYDLDGVPRTLGLHTDVGAYEQRVAAAATTSPASDVTPTGGALHAHVAPNGSAASYHFEYGTSTAYGTSTPERALAEGTPALDVSEPLSGLAAGTAYHARVVVTGPGGGASGDDVAFTTAAALTTPIPITITRTVPAPTPKPATRPCTVPSVKAGSTVLAAITKIAKAGCKLGSTTKARSKKVRKGRVIRITIKARTKTTKSVGLVVSRGRR